MHLTQSVAHSADMLLGAIAAGMRLLQQPQLQQQQLLPHRRDNEITVQTRALALAASTLLQLYYPTSNLSTHKSQQSNQMHMSTPSLSSSSSSSSSMMSKAVTPLNTSIITTHTPNDAYLQQAFAIIHSALSYRDGSP